MSFTRDMMPAWELKAALDASEAEITRLRAEVKRLQEALTPLLSKEARNRLTEYAEAARGMDRNKMATTLEIVLESDAKRRAALTAQEKTDGK